MKFLTFIALMALAAPAAAATGSDQQVRAAVQDLAAAFTKGDTERVVALASKDLHLIHPTRGEADYAAYAAAVRQMRKPTRPDQQLIKVEIDHLHVMGDIAAMHLTWRTRLTAPDGTIRLRGERDQEVWRRETDGKWRLLLGASYPLTIDRFE